MDNIPSFLILISVEITKRVQNPTMNIAFLAQRKWKKKKISENIF